MGAVFQEAQTWLQTSGALSLSAVGQGRSALVTPSWSLCPAREKPVSTDADRDRLFGPGERAHRLETLCFLGLFISPSYLFFQGLPLGLTRR